MLMISRQFGSTFEIVLRFAVVFLDWADVSVSMWGIQYCVTSGDHQYPWFNWCWQECEWDILWIMKQRWVYIAWCFESPNKHPSPRSVHLIVSDLSIWRRHIYIFLISDLPNRDKVSYSWGTMDLPSAVSFAIASECLPSFLLYKPAF